MFGDNSKIPFTVMLSKSSQRPPNHIIVKTIIIVLFDFLNYICHSIYNLFCLFTLCSSSLNTFNVYWLFGIIGDLLQ